MWTYLCSLFVPVHFGDVKSRTRVSRAANQEEAQSFADFLLRVGEGREPTVDGKIRLPDSIVSKSKSVKNFVKESFPNLSNNVGNGEYFAKQVILTPTNADVHDINSLCCESLSNIQSKTYVSADSVEEDLEHLAECLNINLNLKLVFLFCCSEI